MKKKILGSALVLTAAVLAVVAGTQAFFSDKEVSTDNTFKSGAIDLQVDSKCTYNGVDSEQCGTWGLRDLGQVLADRVTDQVVLSDRFFNFSDLKPGDYGENTISLHVRNNDAHACLIVDNMANDDLDLTEPEIEAGDTSVGADKGELAQAVKFLAWEDLDGDNVWEYGENPLFSNVYGPASDVIDGRSYYLGTMPGGEFNDETKTKYMGVYWCYGDLDITMATETGPNTLVCDGKKLDNTTQTDQLMSDVWFYVEQTRHNEEGFECPEPRHLTFVLDEQASGANLGYNQENKNNSWPYVEWDPITGDSITFRFHNPTSISATMPFYFDYNVDGQPGHAVGGVTGATPSSGRLVGIPWDNFHNFVVVGPGETKTVTVQGTDEIKFRLRLGPERDYDFNWIVFKAVM